MTNTSQPHPGFLPPEGEKGKNTCKGREGKCNKGYPRNEKEVGELPSDDDTETQGNDLTGVENDEDGKVDNEDLPPDDDTEFCRNDKTKGNIVDEKFDHEESPKVNREHMKGLRNSDQITGQKNNNMLTPLTEKEKTNTRAFEAGKS